MHIFGLISLMVVVGLAMWWVVGFGPVSHVQVVENPSQAEEDPLDPVIVAHIAEKADLIVVDSPQPNEVITSPLTISGQARGYWFFEASFPYVITDWDGRIIAEHYATAEGDWMTEEFVPFTSTIEFESPYTAGDPEFMRRGTLILQRDNPSGLPENDDALEFPIYFAAPPATPEARVDYGDALQSAQNAADMMGN